METIELIEEYFKGDMPPEERQRFEEAVRGDPALANELAFYISSGLAASELASEERKERFRTLEENRQPAVGKVVSMKKLWWAAAAAVVLIISVYLGTESPSANTLADKYVDESKFLALSIEQINPEYCLEIIESICQLPLKQRLPLILGERMLIRTFQKVFSTKLIAEMLEIRQSLLVKLANEIPLSDEDTKYIIETVMESRLKTSVRDERWKGRKFLDGIIKRR